MVVGVAQQNSTDVAVYDERGYSPDELGPVTVVSIKSLAPADSPRLAGEDSAHTRALAEVESGLPPIIVHRTTMKVIDGMHRLRAALLRGQKTIEVRFFDGSADLAFLLAVRANITHGLPLSRPDRESAAMRIIAIQPRWSDRAIAAATGLSARTVSEIRRRSTDAGQQLNARLGRDGRVRPINGAVGRLRASQIIKAHSDLPLREVARLAGISLGTARDVRERIRQGLNPLPPTQRANGDVDSGDADRHDGDRNDADRHDGDRDDADRHDGDRDDADRHDGDRDNGDRDGERAKRSDERRGSARPPVPGQTAPRQRRAARTARMADWAAIRQKLRNDPALKYSESGRAFLNWMDSHVVDSEEWKSVIDAVPPHWSSDIADLARSCADRWLDIAQALDWKSPMH